MADITSAFGNLSLENAIRQSMEKRTRMEFCLKIIGKNEHMFEKVEMGIRFLLIYFMMERVVFWRFNFISRKFMQPLIEKRENAAILNLEQNRLQQG